VYQARTYIRHIVHTLRTKGREDPGHVTRWVDRAADRLGRARSGRLRAGRIERSGLGPALPSKEELTMPTEKLLAQQAAARHDFDGRIARITTPEFVAGPLLHRLAKAAATRPGQAETLLEQADRLEEAARKLRLQLVQAHGRGRLPIIPIIPGSWTSTSRSSRWHLEAA